MGELEQMLHSLGPNTGAMHWNIALYWIFFLNLILLFMLPDGQTMQTLLAISVLMSAVLDKTFSFGYLLDPGRYSAEYYHEQIFIGTYIIRVLMFLAPLMIAGSTRSGKVRGVAIFAALSGVGYAFGRWFLDQRGNASEEISFMILNLKMVAQSVGILLVLAEMTLRHPESLGGVDRHVPITIPGELTSDELEV